MRVCRACGEAEHGLDRCDVAARKRSALVVHAPELVVHEKERGSSRHGKYLDLAKRREYRRKWAVTNRAKLKGVIRGCEEKGAGS